MNTNQTKVRVLLVDDHELVREGLAALIAKDPTLEVVGQWSSGLNVVELVRQLCPHVVVLDIRLDGLNGLDVCRDLTQRVKDVSVLMLTMYDDELFVARALENGAAGYLLKEGTAEQLNKAIRQVAKGELYLGNGISRDILDHLGSKAGDPYDLLTLRERQVLQMIAEGKNNRQISEKLEVAIKTIDTHRTRLMRKLSIHNVNALVKYAIKKGIVALDQ